MSEIENKYDNNTFDIKEFYIPNDSITIKKARLFNNDIFIPKNTEYLNEKKKILEKTVNRLNKRKIVKISNKTEIFMVSDGDEGKMKGNIEKVEAKREFINDNIEKIKEEKRKEKNKQRKEKGYLDFNEDFNTSIKTLFASRLFNYMGYPTFNGYFSINKTTGEKIPVFEKLNGVNSGIANYYKNEDEAKQIIKRNIAVNFFGDNDAHCGNVMFNKETGELKHIDITFRNPWEVFTINHILNGSISNYSLSNIFDENEYKNIHLHQDSISEEYIKNTIKKEFINFNRKIFLMNNEDLDFITYSNSELNNSFIEKINNFKCTFKLHQIKSFYWLYKQGNLHHLFGLSSDYEKKLKCLFNIDDFLNQNELNKGDANNIEKYSEFLNSLGQTPAFNNFMFLAESFLKNNEKENYEDLDELFIKNQKSLEDALNNEKSNEFNRFIEIFDDKLEIKEQHDFSKEIEKQNLLNISINLVEKIKKVENLNENYKQITDIIGKQIINIIIYNNVNRKDYGEADPINIVKESIKILELIDKKSQNSIVENSKEQEILDNILQEYNYRNDEIDDFYDDYKYIEDKNIAEKKIFIYCINAFRRYELSLDYEKKGLEFLKNGNEMKAIKSFEYSIEMDNNNILDNLLELAKNNKTILNTLINLSNKKNKEINYKLGNFYETNAANNEDLENAIYFYNLVIKNKIKNKSLIQATNESIKRVIGKYLKSNDNTDINFIYHCVLGNSKEVENLINEKKIKNNNTLLDNGIKLAIKNNNTNIIKILLKNKELNNTLNEEEKFFNICIFDDLEKVKKYLESEENLDKKTLMIGIKFAIEKNILDIQNSLNNNGKKLSVFSIYDKLESYEENFKNLKELLKIPKISDINNIDKFYQELNNFNKHIFYVKRISNSINPFNHRVNNSNKIISIQKILKNKSKRLLNKIKSISLMEIENIEKNNEAEERRKNTIITNNSINIQTPNKELEERNPLAKRVDYYQNKLREIKQIEENIEKTVNKKENKNEKNSNLIIKLINKIKSKCRKIGKDFNILSEKIKTLKEIMDNKDFRKTTLPKTIKIDTTIDNFKIKIKSYKDGFGGKLFYKNNSNNEKDRIILTFDKDKFLVEQLKRMNLGNEYNDVIDIFKNGKIIIDIPNNLPNKEEKIKNFIIKCKTNLIEGYLGLCDNDNIKIKYTNNKEDEKEEEKDLYDKNNKIKEAFAIATDIRKTLDCISFCKNRIEKISDNIEENEKYKKFTKTITEQILIIIGTGKLSNNLNASIKDGKNSIIDILRYSNEFLYALTNIMEYNYKLKKEYQIEERIKTQINKLKKYNYFSLENFSKLINEEANKKEKDKNIFNNLKQINKDLEKINKKGHYPIFIFISLLYLLFY